MSDGFPGWFSTVTAWSSVSASPGMDTTAPLSDGRADKKSTFTSGTSLVLTFDFGSAKTLGGVALVNYSQLDPAATVAVAASTDNFGASNVAIKAATPLPVAFPNNADAAVVFAPVSYRYWRLTVSLGVAQPMTLGEVLWAGVVSAFPRRDTYGVGFSYQVPSMRNELGNGSVYTAVVGNMNRQRRISFALQRGETERDAMLAMWQASNGGTRGVLWAEDVTTVSAGADSDSTPRRCIFGICEPMVEWSESDFRIFGFGGITVTEFGR